jgi:hypothetical protein
MLKLRRARARDIVKFTRFAVPRNFYGIVAEEDGELIGAGVLLHGALDRMWVALEITDKLRERPIVMHRIGKALVAAAVTAGEELYVMQDQSEPTSQRWLDRLGFRDTGEVFEGERVLKWHQYCRS